jgi:hypothetical protein
MTYVKGSLVQASDYNNFAGGASANVNGQLNSIWSTGKGSAGYGQTAVANVTAVANLITATQWTTLVTALNNARKHQSGNSYTSLGTYTAGTLVNATTNFASNLAAAYANRLTASATYKVTGSNFASGFTFATNTSAQTFQLTRTATFANANAARYFFNAGGSLTIVFNANSSSNDGTTRSADLITLATTNLVSKTVFGQDCGLRTGVGGTVNTDLQYGAGYYAQTTSNLTLIDLTSTTYTYTGDNIKIYGKTNGVQGSNSDNGTVFYFGVDLTSGARGASFNQSIDITLNHQIDVNYPAGGFLANTWGAVTIA